MNAGRGFVRSGFTSAAALIFFLVSCGDSGFAPTTETETPTAAQVNRVSGNAQSATVGTALPDSLVVRVQDANGNNVPGVTVSWSVTSGGGSVSPTQATTSASGLARAVWTMGTTAGSGSARAAVAGAGNTTFTATALEVNEPTPPPPSVARVVVTPASLALDSIGAQASLAATAYDSDNAELPDTDFSWISLDTAIATVNPAGRVTARSFGTALIIGAAVCCESADTTAVSVTQEQQVDRVVITPPDASLEAIGAQVTLTAVAYNADDQAMPGADLHWSTLDSMIATVDSMGRVTARGVGTALIVATALCCSEADTTGIDVTQPVATLEVMPPTLSLDVGDTGTLDVTARDANQNVVDGPSVTWTTSSSSVATVSAGQVTAVSSGTAVIRAASGDGADSTIVTVNTTTPPPPAALANECASPGASWIWCDDFSQDRLSSYFEYDNAGGNFVRVAAVGVDGTSGMRATFGSGLSNAGSLKLAFGQTPDAYFNAVDDGTTRYRDVYWRMYVRNASDWTGGGGDKLSRAIVFANSSWAEAAIGHVWSSGSGHNFLMIDPASGTDAAGTLQTTQYNDFDNLRWIGGSVGSTPIFNSANIGQWHCVEAHMRLNDAGQSNGVFEMWIDDNLDARSIGLNWLGSYSAYGINALFIENYWNAGSPQDQSRYIDNIVVSTERIGCGESPGTPPPPPPPAPVSTVTISPSSPTVTDGNTVQLTATLRDANNNVLTGRTVTWSSGNTNTATVNSSGVVTGVAAGSTAITATSEGQSSQVTVTVDAPTPPPAIATVTVTPGSATRTAPNGQVQLTATGFDSNGNTVPGATFSWSSSNTGVATVNSTGMVLVQAVGTAVITATAVCCGAQGSSNITGTSGTEPNVPPSIEEDFTSYTSTAHMLSDPRGIYRLSEDFYGNDGGSNNGAGEIHLDTSVQYDGHPTMRYQWYPTGPSNGGTISRQLGVSATELWVEAVVRFSSDFRISNGYSGGSAYKFMFGTVTGATGRFDLEFDNSDSGNLALHAPAGTGDDYVTWSGGGITDYFTDNQWHVVRWYIGPNAHRLWVDGTLRAERTGLSKSWSDIYGLSLGRNINQQPVVAQTLHWGRVRIWTNANDPGW